MSDVERRLPGDERHATSLQGWLIDKEGRRQKVTVVSLSGEGCGLEGAAVSVGQRLDLLVAGEGFTSVEIRWTAGPSAGARFIAAD